MKKHNSLKFESKEINSNFGEMCINLWDFNEPRKHFLYEQENRKEFEFESVNEDENKSIENIPHSRTNNQIKKSKKKIMDIKKNNNLSNKKSSSYRPQISLPNDKNNNNNNNNNINIKKNDNKMNKSNNSKIKRTKSVEKSNFLLEKKPKKSSSSLDKKSIKQNKHYNLNIDIRDYSNPDNVIKYIKNKCNNNEISKNNNIKKEDKKKRKEEINEYINNLYKKQIASKNYEKLNKLKKIKDEEKEKEELSKCTFKPQLISNKYNKKKETNNNSLNLYEKQNKWLNRKNEKLEKKYENKVNKEMENCSFNPRIIKMPNFQKNQIKGTNREILEKEIYYTRIKNARKKSQEIEKKNDFIAKYDARKKREENIKFNNNNTNFFPNKNNKNIFSSAEKNKNYKKNIFNIINTELNNDNINSNCSDINLNNKNINSCENLFNGNNFTLTNNFTKNNVCHNNIIDEDFQRQKEILMNELHNWKNDEDNSEEEDEFY